MKYLVTHKDFDNRIYYWFFRGKKNLQPLCNINLDIAKNHAIKGPIFSLKDARLLIKLYKSIRFLRNTNITGIVFNIQPI